MGICDVGPLPPSPAQRRHRALVGSLWYPSSCGLYPLVTATIDAWVSLYPCPYPSLSRWLTFDWVFDRPASSGCFSQEYAVFLVGGGHIGRVPRRPRRRLVLIGSLTCIRGQFSEPAFARPT
jgi:hypothetical protein